MVFTMQLHVMQCTVFGRHFCPPVKRTDCDKMKETCAHILIPQERLFVLVFWKEKWLMGDDPFYLNLELNWPRSFEKKTIFSWFSLIASQL